MTAAEQPQGVAPTRLLSVGAGLLVLAGVLAWNIGEMDPPRAVGVGPTAAMRIVCVMLTLLGLCHVVAAWRAPRRSRELSGSEANLAAVAWILAGLLGLIASLLAEAGFVIGSAWLFVATARAFGQRIGWLSPAVGLGLSVTVYLFFTKALTLALPSGLLERLLFG